MIGQLEIAILKLNFSLELFVVMPSKDGIQCLHKEKIFNLQKKYPLADGLDTSVRWYDDGKNNYSHSN